MPEMPPDLATIARMRAEGRAERDIAAVLCIPVRRVSDRAARWNARHPDAKIPPAVSRRAETDYAKAAQMKIEGMSYAEIARALNVPFTTVGGILRLARARGYVATTRSAATNAYEAYDRYRQKGAAPPMGKMGDVLKHLAPEHADALLCRMRTEETTLAQTIARILREHLERP